MHEPIDQTTSRQTESKTRGGIRRFKRALVLLTAAALGVAACDIIDEAHYAPSSTLWGFAETATGDFYAVNTSSALSCYVTGTLQGSMATDGSILRPVQSLATSYNGPPDTVWGVVELGDNYQTAWESKYNILAQFDVDCDVMSSAWMPSPPANHDYWVYDIAASDDGQIYVLVDDTVIGAQDYYRIFHTTNGGGTWTMHTVSSTEHATLAGACFPSNVTERAHMSFDRYNHEVVLLACDEAIRYDGSTLAYVGSRELDIDVDSLYDFDTFVGFSVVSYEDATLGNRLAVVSAFGPILDTRAGFYLDVQFRQPTNEAIEANPWGARFMANGYDPQNSTTRIHRFKAEN